MQKCFECDKTENLHNHHIVPRIKGGKRTIPLCEECHGKVHGKNFLNLSNLINEGLSKAKQEGRIGGRPKISQEQINKIIEFKKIGYSNRKISRELKISNSTVGEYTGIPIKKTPRVSRISKLVLKGLEKARLEGRIGGRPKIPQEQIDKIIELKKIGYSNRKIGRELKISNSTVGLYI